MSPEGSLLPRGANSDLLRDELLFTKQLPSHAIKTSSFLTIENLLAGWRPRRQAAKGASRTVP